MEDLGACPGTVCRGTGLCGGSVRRPKQPPDRTRGSRPLGRRPTAPLQSLARGRAKPPRREGHPG